MVNVPHFGRPPPREASAAPAAPAREPTQGSAAGPIPPADLRALWDFGEPEASARRFREAAGNARSATHRDELLTQRARALGLAGHFDEADALLGSIVSNQVVVRVRVLLERGRLRNSDGDAVGGLPFFRAACELASEHGLAHLAVDALHMLAIVDEGHEQQWTYRGLAVATGSRDPEVRGWLIALHNNLGWHLHDQGRLADALEQFHRAHAASREVGTPEQEAVARWAIARCLRSMGRHRQALEMQRALLLDRPDDPDVREEIEILEGMIGDSTT